MKIFNFEQYSPEWFKIRLGIPTSSNFDKLLTAKTAKPSTSAKTYAYALVAELLTGEAEDGYTNAHMERGLALEGEARTLYELLRDVDVQEVGFCLADKKDCGCSPDGLVGKDGGLEIKCPKRSTHVKYMHRPEFLVGDYKQQVQGGLLITGREWWDIESYYPGMPEVIERVKPDVAYQNKLQVQIEAISKRVKKIHDEIKKGEDNGQGLGQS